MLFRSTYGLDIWYTPPIKKPGQTRNSGSAGALRQLQKVQRIASLAIVGALRSTPTDFLDAHAGLLPIELALLKATHRAMTRMMTLPNTHPLHPMIAYTKENPPRKHHSPIATLLKTFKLQRKNLEIIYPVAQCPPRALKFTTSISETREDSIKEEKADKADFKAFSDGSGLDGDVGAVAVLYRTGWFTPLHSLKYFIGSSSKHNTFEAEAIGAILATKLLSDCPDTIGKRVSLYIDNQALIKSIRTTKATSGQYLIRHLTLLANALGCSLGVRWISSHSKVRGNEKADELAKEAASGTSSEAERLPHLVTAPLPLSTSAAKQAYHSKLKERWKDSWTESERGDRFKEIDEKFPFNSYRKRTYRLTRSQASTLNQLRSGHIPLNNYLFKINRSESDLCQACQEDNYNTVQCKETVKHFLFECPAYEEYRNELINKISRSHLNLRDMMSDTDRMTALAQYITRTSRFKK